MQVNQLESWTALRRDAGRLSKVRTETLFELEPARLSFLALEAAGVYADFSKNRIDKSALGNLLALAEQQNLTPAIRAMFIGESVNTTENRPALHTLLRASSADRDDPIQRERLEQIGAVRSRMLTLAERLRSGDCHGHGGAVIRDVVNIGIGGSHLGPQLVCEALQFEKSPDINVHFVSNVDGVDIDRIISNLNPETTLFVVASKSFTTAETLLNAHTASNWITAHFDDRAAVRAHFVALTAKPDRALAFGIDGEKVFPMWDWVGGRYSLWSAIGLAIAISIGSDGFEQLLAGANAMDGHFRNASLQENIPVMLALIGIWNTNFLDYDTLAVVPYDDRLPRLPEYLQQLEMESNGKRVSSAAEPVTFDTAPILWGGVGTNAQHAFFQHLHQGTRRTAVDFIVALKNGRSPRAHQDMLVANCIAQAEGLMRGRGNAAADGAMASTAEGVLELHRACPGNRPSTMLVVDELNPRTLGALLALYEHKTYVQAVIWGINPFDQWGVEIGKHLADSILEDLRGSGSARHDPSTEAMIARYKRAQGTP